MLKLGEVNPLAVFGGRRMGHLPPHFTVVRFDLKTAEKVLTDWIWVNLSGRFYLGDWIYEDDAKNTQMHKCVGFEIPGEASYFSLILDTINTPSEW